jgi:drug/metabolite transporter (DMT)-like permease
VSLGVVALILVSALLHASWNAALRSGLDRFWSIAVMSAVSATVALPFALALPAPAVASWPFLAASSLLELVYFFFLVRAYRTGDLGQVYPIARGSSPMLVTLGAAVVASEQLAPLAIAGVVLVSLGIVGFASGRGALDRRSLLYALATGVCIACYTVTDGLGARASGDTTSYVAWLFVCHGAPMPIIYLVVRRRLPPNVWSRETLKAGAGGLVSLLAYGIVVTAMSLSPMGAVSALRETSVLFAALLGRVLLGERLGPSRAISCLAIAAGAVCLGLAR